jgi:uncharacterized protein YqhQ
LDIISFYLTLIFSVSEHFLVKNVFTRYAAEHLASYCCYGDKQKEVDTHIERVIRQDKQKGSVHLCGTKAFIEENLLKRECKTKKKKQYTNKHANCKQVFLTSLFLLFFFFLNNFF